MHETPEPIPPAVQRALDNGAAGRVGALLTLGNPKTAKSVAFGYLTAILHLSPARSSRRWNVCPFASAGCASACLTYSGRGGIALDADRVNSIQLARIRRTAFLMTDRGRFLAQLEKEIGALQRSAARLGLTPCVRPNGTSDIPFERIAPELFEIDLQWYDYTKIAGRSTPPNYHLTFSRSESNERAALRELRAGTNVAVVFRGDLPRQWNGSPVVDGDVSDLRFLDPSSSPGVVVGLRAKGRFGAADRSGFVVDY